MTKILAVIGSCAGKKSNTAKLADILAEKIQTSVFGGNAEYERITLDQIRINFCHSCSSCFKKGFCPNDESDDMAMLKKKILDCDVLIIGSPVYLGNVSGVCKAMLDRIAFWAHTFELIGKPCIVISTTSNNNEDKAIRYLNESLGHMGAIVVTQLTVFVDRGSPMLSNKEEMDTAAEECCRNLSVALDDPTPFITQQQLLSYQYFNRIFQKHIAFTKKYPAFTNYEIERWKSSGFIQFDSFHQAVLNTRQQSFNRNNPKE